MILPFRLRGESADLRIGCRLKVLPAGLRRVIQRLIASIIAMPLKVSIVSLGSNPAVSISR
jgi:hypothetical protein